MTKINTKDRYDVRVLMQKYDFDNDGKITEEELVMIERIIALETKKAKESDRDKREDAQRSMAWFGLFGMIMYPLSVIIAVLFGLTVAADILGNMAGTYFVSVAAIVAAFFGTQAYTSKRDADRED
jgi:hypothetical protein